MFWWQLLLRMSWNLWNHILSLNHRCSGNPQPHHSYYLLSKILSGGGTTRISNIRGDWHCCQKRESQDHAWKPCFQVAQFHNTVLLEIYYLSVIWQKPRLTLSKKTKKDRRSGQFPDTQSRLQIRRPGNWKHWWSHRCSLWKNSENEKLLIPRRKSKRNLPIF